ncbi:MAG: 30S ribosomal protein S3 [Thermoproteota archaeon]|nr:MAG: 30S ribosomal protein S3 [Candidatus Korarchaeota archaeon]RLG55193.1 MAG: 30S ribosomal protein S3 [Candidatus Korarchaeota archaeon]
MEKRPKSIVKRILEESYLRVALDEFLRESLERAGYSKLQLIRAPIRDRLVLSVERPSIVIGKHGKNALRLSRILEERFKLNSPRIETVELDKPYLVASIAANRIARMIERGYKPRRAASLVLRRIMDDGALGVEIRIKGKISGERARRLVIREGVMLKSGQPALELVDEGVAEAMLKQGVIGVKVKILRPTRLPDEYEIDHEKAKSLYDQTISREQPVEGG